MTATTLCTVVTLLSFAVCQDITTLEKDFNIVLSRPEVGAHARPVLERLAVFKVPVHPRIRLFHTLLKRTLWEYSARSADTLYVPYKYTDPGYAQQPNSDTAQQTNSDPAQQPNSDTAQQPNSETTQQPNNDTAQQPNNDTAT